MQLEKYSMGVGDRFGQEAAAQLESFIKARDKGLEVVPVWNKSYREHSLIGTTPEAVLAAAEKAVTEKSWPSGWYIDADHINFTNVDGFIPFSTFFTLDVAEEIGKKAPGKAIEAFMEKHKAWLERPLSIPGLAEPLTLTKEAMAASLDKYLFACRKAGEIYRHLADKKGKDNFITEVSMDETSEVQSPEDILIILAALADEEIPLQTLAPRFPGRFNKGVEYVGDVAQFERAFEEMIAVLHWGRDALGLPDNLKLSVHSGSDKFVIYPAIRRVLGKTGAGLHLKTAGTTWLEEVIGLAQAGGKALDMAKDIYAKSLSKREELSAPYAEVIDIDPAKLPSEEDVRLWSSEDFYKALHHDSAEPSYNPHFRQLLHVGYKIAAHMGEDFISALQENREAVAREVTANIDRHIGLLFG